MVVISEYTIDPYTHTHIYIYWSSKTIHSSRFHKERKQLIFDILQGLLLYYDLIIVKLLVCD